MKKKPIILILNCTLILFAGTFYTFGHEKKINLIDKRITVKMEKQPLGLVFRYLMKNYDISIGFEKSTLDAGNSDYEFDTNLPEVAYESHQSKDGTIQFDFEVENAFFP